MINLIGKVFGKLVVEEEVEKLKYCRRFRCVCSCGREKIISYNHLVWTGTKSCGCSKATHGQSHTPTYSSWANMLERCYNPNCMSYSNYGGRGIFVCDRWRNENGFLNFLADMGERPGSDYSPDRINTNGNYEPDNCEWKTCKEQQRNRTNNLNIEYNGKTQCLAAWAEELNIKYQTLYTRLSKNWSIEKTFTYKR